MKILHILSQHPDSTGSGYWLQNMLRQAARHGHANRMVAGISSEQLPQLSGIDNHNCRFVTFGAPPLAFPIPGMSDVMPYPSSRFADLNAAQIEAYQQAFKKVIAQALVDFSPDIIHSHHLWLVSAIARQLAPTIPMVTSCHSTDLRQFHLCPQLQERVRPWCRQIDRVLALSRDQKVLIEQIFGIEAGRIDLVGGGFAAEYFNFRTKDQRPPVRLLYAGKLSFAKGVDSLLRVFATLADSNLELHLAGSGSGAEEKRCLDLAKTAGDRVYLHGRVSQPQLAGLMGSAHLFVLPSLYEGLPLVLLEALASGCRIITTTLPGCRELLESVDPELVDIVELPVMAAIDRPMANSQGDFERRLAASIITMVARIRSRPSRPSPAEVARITSGYAWEAVFARVEAAYRQACNDRVSHGK
jgi:glycosyltransferase involved in cell wall biosynthesis